MNRLIASTMTHSTYDLKDALERLKAAGFEKFELCSAGALAPHFDVSTATLKTISETAAIIRTSGMKPHCINIGGSYTLEQMEHVFALAEITGAGIITCSCGYLGDGEKREEKMKEVAEFNSKLADLGEKYGVICAIEAPHKNSLASTTEQVDEYWSMQDPRVKLTFDTAHLTFYGEDMLALAEKYVSRMVHSHIRDAKEGNSLLRYGQGVVDFEKYFEILKRGGYTGMFSMEYPSESAEDAAMKLEESVKFLSKFNI